MSVDSPLIFPNPPRLLSFLLPQFHPIPENDEWWGPGFTEWRNVTRGRPLFQGHHQPHLPADLGFYDLRIPEVRAQQAALARSAGIEGFVYYHYWFNGRRLLERPFDEVLRLGEPDFPFCLCWANEPWSRNWDGNSRQVLQPQSYSDQDDEAHIQWLLRAFDDPRYIRIDGRPLFLIYRPSQLPDMRATAARWRAAAERHGLPGLHLTSVRAFPEEWADPAQFGLDAAVEFKPNGTDCGESLRSQDPLDIGYRIHRVWDYAQLVAQSLAQPVPNHPFYPGVCPSWDNSVRRLEGGMIFRDATPQQYEFWLREVLLREMLRPSDNRFVFLNAWNEWAEGNHLEPCQRWGRGYLDATRAALDYATRRQTALKSLARGQELRVNPDYRVHANCDRIEARSDTIESRGWCIEADSGHPPDLLVYASRNAEGSFVLIGRVEQQRVPRADVVQHLSNPSARMSGWIGSLPATALEGSASLHILALRAEDFATAEVGRLS